MATDTAAGRRSGGYLGAMSALGGVQLMASMDGPVVVFALPRIQQDLGLSDAGRSWVVTAYLLTFGGLVLLGGRLGDTLGRRRTFLAGVAMFTAASAVCGLAGNGTVLVAARLVHGAAGAIVAPTCMALVASTFPKGRPRNVATAVLGATTSIGSVLGLVVGGLLTEVSWRLAFLVNVPIGLLVLALAAAVLTESGSAETGTARMRLDAAGAVLATVVCTAAVYGLSIGPERGWGAVGTLAAGAVAVGALLVFVVVERSTANPVVPLSLFADRSRLATYAAMFLARGVGFTLTVLIALYLQTVLGYRPLQAAVAFIPFALAMAAGVALSSRLVTWWSPRVVVLTGALLVAVSLLYGGATLGSVTGYFPQLVVPIVVGAVGVGMTSVPLGLSLIASVGLDRIGPASAVAVVLQSLGGPLVLVAVQAVIATRTASSSDGYADGLFWLTGVIVLLAGVALLIGYSSRDIAHAQADAQAHAQRVAD
jgi:EmrB/QacA subfamily drug resistance transporter